MSPKCWLAYCCITRRGTGGRVGRCGRGMRKPKRGNVDQVDIFELTIQMEIMVLVLVMAWMGHNEDIKDWNSMKFYTFDNEADSHLESMPGGEIESLSGFKADESDNDDPQSMHKEELSKTEEAATDNILDELADMANYKNENVNAFADKPS
uniref:Uncharacterized protein n=1 Tax=Tanacetum cinerariifolium TaxID=118510 RepID=A0A6L2LRQ0_TANCI|nr:hypothetical protein [Tanacetum cinerariifolium]